MVLVILSAWATQTYYLTINQAEIRVTGSAKIVASNAYWIYQLGIQAVRRIDESLSDSDLQFTGTVRNIGVETQGLPANVVAYVVDATGRTLLSTDPDINTMDVTDRDYFTAVQNGQLEYVSPMLICRLNGTQIFVISRRIVRNGVFKGAVIVSMPADIMRAIWETVDLGGNFTVSLIRNDGMLMARYPRASKTLDMSGYVLFTQYLRQSSSGVYLAEASPLDGAKRLVSYRRVEGTPLVAVAAADYNVLIQPFWSAIYMLGSIGLAIAAGAVAGGWWIHHLLRAQDRQAVELEQALQTNEMLLREIHHRVKNNLQSVLSLVRMHIRRAEGSEALNNRIRSMIAVHEQIYMHDEYAAIDAALLIETVVKNALSAHESRLSVLFDLAPQRLFNDKATALALLVNEVVTNAVKYAYPSDQGGALWVTLFPPTADGLTELIIRDEGQGFDPVTTQKGTGSRLIDGSVHQLGGVYRFEANAGTTFVASLRLS
ncbi:sensor histidine kinase [Rhizobium sp. TRM95796]|uniref:sensor histidine kinase n=1 Tax=Rhizobium sp. TRM95796 TaxID=2979862 RepID=UPI0021E6E2BE|nr:cache domain-containing protein [Rhizobium sp. TRM95796]MCV3768676.1 cache domain-containing protein [Rhizobium sp. TRM95796]